MSRLLLSLAAGLPTMALAATPTFTVVDLGTTPGLQWAAVQPTVDNSATVAGGSYGSLGGGITYIYQPITLSPYQPVDPQLPVVVAVGESTVANSGCAAMDFHAFLFLPTSAMGGTMEDLGTLGGCQSAALSLNASHVVVGWAQESGGPTLSIAAQGGLQTAFVWHNGTMQALPSLLHTFTTLQESEEDTSSANGINDGGEIVGWTMQLLGTGQLAPRAVLWENGAAAEPLELQYQLGDKSGSVILTIASAISCQGDIAVTGYPASSSSHQLHTYLLVHQGAHRSCPD
ncbi:MAG: hypothetical protein ACRET2_00425 [Steroidobacteraceae bacterium]